MPKRQLQWSGTALLLCLPFISGAQASTSTELVSPEVVTSSNWLRQPALSPDGKQLLFTKNGGIYRVATAGGEAFPVVVNSHWNGYPVWSKDGKRIAYASDQYGSLDVFVVNAGGGEPKRLTFHSADDVPADFNVDGDGVLFASPRGLPAQSSGFPNRGARQLYQVPVGGGTPTMLVDASALEAKYSPDGKSLLYVRNKGFENLYRKHDRSSFARDIWRYDIDAKRHSKLTTFVSDERTPVWSPDGDTIYFASEAKADSVNLWQMNADGSNPQRLTDHQIHSIRDISVAAGDQLAYSFHGELYRMKPGETPQRIEVRFAGAAVNSGEQMASIAGKAGNYAVSPNGKEIAFIARGDLFVTAVDYGTTVQITNSPEQERNVSWLEDGRGLVYSSERDGVWGLYQTKLTDDSEPYFFAATGFAETTLLKGKQDQFQPRVSPDGRKVAYLHQRDEIRVLDIASGNSVTVFDAKFNYSYSDGDIEFSWSPDSRWLAATYIPYGMLFYKSVGIAPADGSQPPRDVSLSGYDATSPVWASGDILLFNSSRFGQRAHASWGGDYDVMALFLNQQAYDRHLQDKEQLALAAEADEAKQADDEEQDGSDEAKVEPINIDWDGIEQRTVRLTSHSADLGAAALTDDGKKLYYLAKYEKGYDLWLHDLTEQSTQIAVKLNAGSASMQLTQDEQALLLWADGNFAKIALDDSHGKTDIAYQHDQRILPDAERHYLFDHIWRQTKDKFYRTDMHGVDWQRMYQDYAVKVAGVDNNRDFAILTSELLGELNASHTGTYYRAQKPAHSNTASLGVIFAPAANNQGLRIDEVLPHSPLSRADIEVKPGTLLTHVNGKAVNGQHNLFQQLNGVANKRTRLTLSYKGKARDVVVRPVSLQDEQQARYLRWVDQRRALVDKLSNGKLAYVHIPQMDDEAYRAIFAEIFGRGFTKQALVVDTRFNGGGWLTDDLVTLLSGKQYTANEGRGKQFKGNPMNRWTKPSIVVMNEGNYSDGHCFPTAYKANNIGKTVGMPVPGTCTAVWWENLHTEDMVFGIPQLGVLNMEGEYLENLHLSPDLQVDNDPESTSAGEDKQLATAVAELLKE